MTGSYERTTQERRALAKSASHRPPAEKKPNQTQKDKRRRQQAKANTTQG